MPRAALRLSPMPRNQDQFFQYLEEVEKAVNEKGAISQSELVSILKSKILQENGNPYAESNIKGVLRNVARFGLIDFVQGETDINIHLLVNVSDWEKEKLGELILSTFEKRGIKDNDPYLIDMLFDFIDLIKTTTESSYSNKFFIQHTTADSSDDKEGNSTSGYAYSNLTQEGMNRAVSEIIKVIEYFGVLEPLRPGHYSECDQETTESILERLRPLRQERFVNLCFNKIGFDHEIFFTKKSGRKVVSVFSKYISYRYSGGIGRHRTLCDDLMKSMEELKNDFLEDYLEKKDRAHKNRELRNFGNLITDHRQLIIDELNQKHNTNQFTIAALSLATLQRIREAPNEVQIELLLAEKTGHKFSAGLVEQTRHKNGEFTLNPDINLHVWQEEAATQWVESGHVGIVNAVTGTGKTIFAIECIRRYIESHPDSLVNIIVPTKVLMYQWAETVAEHLDLGLDMIGLSGDSMTDAHAKGKKVMIRIINSAVNKKSMQKDVQENYPGHNLIIADECHMYGGERYRTFLNTMATALLGISATPPDTLPNGNPHPVVQKMGAPIYTLNYRKASEQGLISRFNLRHVGLDLVNSEQQRYERLSKEMWNCKKEIENAHPWIFDKGNLIAQLQQLLSKGEAHSAVPRYLELIRQRQDVVKNAMNRDTATKLIMEDFLNPESNQANMMIFSERIQEIRNIVSKPPGKFRLDEIKHSHDEEFKKLVNVQNKMLQNLSDKVLTLNRANFGIYHSQFPPKFAHWMVNWYRNGLLNMMISAQALAQGFDVPGADVGLIRSSSGNIRQRIQTIGRLIRKNDDKSAIIWILYVKNTGEESIFTEYDWVSELPENDDVQTYWELNESGTELIQLGGQEMLPVYDRELTHEEISSISVEEIVIGDAYPDPRIVHHAVLELRWIDGSLHFVDMGVEIRIQPDKDLSEQMTLWPKDLRRKCMLTENNHIVGRSNAGTVLFLGEINSEKFHNLCEISKEKIDSFDDFLSGF